MKLNSEYIADFLNFLTSSQMQYEYSRSEMETQDKLTQDILHSIELDNLKYKERARLATILEKNRQERRKYKDALEELAAICEYVEKNRKVINDLQQLLGAVRKVEKYHKNRSYVPKVLDIKKAPKDSHPKGAN